MARRKCSVSIVNIYIYIYIYLFNLSNLFNFSLVKAMFNLAREKKPTVVFVDEIDSLCTSRDVCYETYKTYC